MKNNKTIVIPENPVSRFLFSDTRSGLFWLIIRLYVGFEWLKAGWGKVRSDAWTGENAGTALQGFINGALTKAEGGGDVSGWYASFLENTVLPNAEVFSVMVAYGELLVGLGLILGLLTGIAAFFGALMNVSFLFAGTLSANPLLFILATWLVLAWKVAGWYGLDRWALPKLGTPWTGRKSI
ncbi:DoxX family membrane protein [Sporosarcina thermotolerans]|uniref:DoxX family membrane protein n=1 Tax=Sporosarcina thermotolerans TaxID=633404 RepID=A0AAW9A3T4_9BACL|nr:DoxX family membrane protein [Sporosarcina thermotolerans]MDW0115587.1 DoxX family membrane protein [Sporosarcina thermotolerans]WHT47114.1 DoxX family membrane protein [Sporosarcina thermotolerans]